MAADPNHTVIKGTSGNDFITVPLLTPGSTGTTDVYAGAGNDTIIVGFAPHVGAPVIHAYGGAGNDWIDTSTLNPASATIFGGIGDDTLIGSTAPDTIRGGGGCDTIWMGGADTIYTSGSDHLMWDAYAGSGTIDIHGATRSTTFDFSSVVPLHLNSPSGTRAPEPFTVTRSDFSFDASGNLQVASGAYDVTLKGAPYHDAASLDKAIANGHVIL